jgi:LmbE family N-acetylglucosaminyl deacetylase
VGFTVVSFNAHPDDEALLSAGTLARAVAEGHRVVIVTATDGGAGLAAGAGPGRDLAEVRMAELREAAAALGCADVRHLGYADSGMDGQAAGATFVRADPREAAGRLAAILSETGADVLTIYDPAGGYGHPDHRRVHRVGLDAAALAATPVVLEATVDRRPLVRVLGFARRAGILARLGVDEREWGPERFAGAFAEPGRITHRVAVRRYAPAKRAAMAAHASQTGADEGVRTLAALLRLPAWLFGVVFAHEWFVEVGRVPGRRPLDDIFATLRPSPGGVKKAPPPDGRRSQFRTIR